MNDFLHQPQGDGILWRPPQKPDFSKMPVNEVANYNTAEALDYFWAHKDFAEYFTPQRMMHYDTVNGYLGRSLTQQIDRVVDFGCGCGQMLAHILPWLESDVLYIGMDYATSAIEYSQKHVPQALFIRGDILDNGLPSASYDLALCIEVLEHITDYRKALTEMLRVLKPGGAFVLTVPNALVDFGAPYHVNFWTQEAIVNLLSEYGEIIHHEMIMDNNSTLVHVRKAAE